MIVPGSANALMLGQSQGYNLTKSLRFRSSASAYLNRTPSSTPTSWTLSVWVKRGQLGTTSVIAYSRKAGTDSGGVFFSSGDNLIFDNGFGGYVTTNAVYRDPSAWYHVVVNYNGTAPNIYVNGISQSYTGSATGTNRFMNSGSGWVTAIGEYGDAFSNYFDGYMAEMYFIDGQALTPSSFGSNNAQTGVWQPKKYSGTYGTNGFYLPFTNTTSTTTLGYDFSGNSNNWTTNNLSLTSGSTYDSMTDVPTLTSLTTANYCTINPLDFVGSGTVSDGNLKFVNNGNGVFRSTMGMQDNSSKYYFEITQQSSVTAITPIVYGLASLVGSPSHSAPQRAALLYCDGATGHSLNIYNAGSLVTQVNTNITSISVGDIIQFAYDSTSGKVWAGKNNSWCDASGGSTGNPSTGANPTYTFTLANQPFTPTLDHAGVGYTATLNCGQQGFAYTPPTGFKALNAYNLPTPTIGATASTQANKYMDATLYNGNDSNRTVTNAGSFKPDLVWIKGRNAARFHNLFDSVRGAGYDLRSNSTAAEVYENDTLTAFASNGFSLGTDVTSGRAVNYTGDTYVGWQWQAGQGTTSSNTSGSITSTVSVNASAGFSVVTFTGNGSAATVGHGLGVAPSMIITKSRSNALDWYVYHASLGNAAYLLLDATNAVVTGATAWNTTSPTSSVFSLGGGGVNTNINTYTYVAYCWAEIAGFSKFGSYTGNGSTDGPFVYTGFKPKYVLFKNASAGSTDWIILDSVRDTYNVEGNMLFAELSNAEVSSPPRVDFLSNGFKLRTTAQPNDSSNTIIYAAFAENPFKYSLAR